MDAVDELIEMVADYDTLLVSTPTKSVFIHCSTLTKYIQLLSILALIVPAMSFTHWLYVSIQRYGLLICPPQHLFKANAASFLSTHSVLFPSPPSSENGQLSPYWQSWHIRRSP